MTAPAAAPAQPPDSPPATAAPAQPAVVATDSDAPKTDLAPRPVLTGQLLQERLAATTAWLAAAPPRNYTIQLLGARDDQQLNQHLRFISNIIEINEVLCIVLIAKGEPALTITWGNFDNQRAAREAMAQLPSSLKVYKPLLRTVHGIKTEVARNNPS